MQRYLVEELDIIRCNYKFRSVVKINSVTDGKI